MKEPQSTSDISCCRLRNRVFQDEELYKVFSVIMFGKFLVSLAWCKRVMRWVESVLAGKPGSSHRLPLMCKWLRRYVAITQPPVKRLKDSQSANSLPPLYPPTYIRHARPTPPTTSHRPSTHRIWLSKLLSLDMMRQIQFFNKRS